MKKLILIDGNALIHRAYHALPPLTTPEGEPINAVYGFVGILLGVIQNLKPTHIAVCFDRPEPTFRHEKFKEYQSHRPEADVELASQFQKVYDTVSAMHIASYSQVGFEADDLIGTLARRAQMENFDEVIIVTGDRDILQLVNEKTKVYMPTKGVSEGKLYGEKEVIERMGVPPDKIVDFKALVGDPSDNYPGVPGIGPKTAIKLLETYGDLESIFAHIDEITPSIAKKLKAGKESGFLSKQLAQIVCDAEVTFENDLLTQWKLDADELISLFTVFGFKTLTQRVQKVAREVEASKQLSLL